MATRVTVPWIALGISLQMLLLTFPLFLPVGLMDGAGLWPHCLLQAMEPTLLALQSLHRVPHKKSFISYLSSRQLMNYTF